MKFPTITQIGENLYRIDPPGIICNKNFVDGVHNKIKDLIKI